MFTFERFISATLAYTFPLVLSKKFKSIRSPTADFVVCNKSGIRCTELTDSVTESLGAESCSLIALSKASEK